MDSFQKLTAIRSKMDHRLADHRLAREQYREAVIAKSDADENMILIEQAREIVQTVSQQVQQAAHQRISAVVSRCLAAVFDDPYEFQIAFEKKRGRTDAVLQFVRRGLLLNDPVNEAGGGPQDVAAFALRLACIIMQKPPGRRLMVLDEPFKCIRGKQYRDRVRDLLIALSHEFGVQFIMCVDHIAYPQFLLGKAIEMG